MQDQNVMLRCRASGVPAPSLRWNKEGRAVNQDDRRYRMLRSGWLAIAVVRYDATPLVKCRSNNNLMNSYHSRSENDVDLLLSPSLK